MSKDNDKSLKKLNAQIAKLSKEKEKNEKTPVIKKKDLVRKVKAKKVDEEIEKNKKNSAPKKKRKLPENVEMKDLGNIKVKKKPKKKNNAKTKKEVKEIKDSIIVDEEITTFSQKISSQDIKELENSLREIYDKEIITKKHPNKDFFINEFLSNVNETFNKISGKAKDLSRDIVDKAVELSETPVQGKFGKIKNLDVLSIITIFLSIVFVICAISFVGFIIWICYY